MPIKMLALILFAVLLVNFTFLGVGVVVWKVLEAAGAGADSAGMLGAIVGLVSAAIFLVVSWDIIVR